MDDKQNYGSSTMLVVILTTVHSKAHQITRYVTKNRREERKYVKPSQKLTPSISAPHTWNNSHLSSWPFPPFFIARPAVPSSAPDKRLRRSVVCTCSVPRGTELSSAGRQAGILSFFFFSFTLPPLLFNLPSLSKQGFAVTPAQRDSARQRGVQRERERGKGCSTCPSSIRCAREDVAGKWKV